MKFSLALATGTGMFALGQADPITQAFPYGDLVLNGGALAVMGFGRVPRLSACDPRPAEAVHRHAQRDGQAS